MKVRNIIYCACAASLLCSCSFLDERKPSAITDPYGSEAALEACVHGLIKGLDSSVGITGEVHNMVFSGSGIIHWSNSSTSTRLTNTDYTSNLNFTTFSTHSRNRYYFQHLYTAIDRCNTLLSALPSSPVGEAFKKNIEGEAKFVRAWMYFNLVRMWGDVPLKLEPGNMSTLETGRTKYDKVYVQIVKDLEESYELMTSTRKFAALAYLSTVYTTIGSLLNSPDDNFWNNTSAERRPDFSELGLPAQDQAQASRTAYEKALRYADMLIPDDAEKLPGKITPHADGCPYRLATNFGDLFKWTRGYVTADGCDCWNLPERIFVYELTNQGSSSVLARRTLPQYPFGTKDYSNTDGNYSNCRPCRWVFQKWCETYPGEKGSRYTASFSNEDKTATISVDTPGSSNIYKSSSDPRLEHSMYFLSYLRNDSESPNGKKQYIYPYQSYLTTNPSHVYAMPYLKKYFSSEYNYNAGEADIYFMRLTEMYLNAAEACARTGKTDMAYDYIEVLHDRARKSKAGGESLQPAWTKGQFVTADELVTAIFWERVYEMIGECHEWYDTHRFGATWLRDNIAVPKNEFLNRDEQKGAEITLTEEQKAIIGKDKVRIYYHASTDKTYKEYFYGTDEKIYPESVEKVRQGLLCEIPEDEVNYNSNIGNIKNDYPFQR